MKIYEVVSTYDDKGHTTAHINTLELDSKPKNTYTETERVDIYKEYFTNRKQAEKAVDSVRRV